MLIREYLDKENLHHAYLIEGERELVVSQILQFLNEYGIRENNPDFCHMSTDNFKIDEAFNLKEMSGERAIGEKKFFIISANHFSLEAQNTMLKMFEEPIENTHFFLITRDANALLPTLVSRFFFISAEDKKDNLIEANKFLKLSPNGRINFVKDLLVAPEDEVMEDSARTKALKFLNSLETALHQPMSKTVFDTDRARIFEQIMKAREYLRQPGASSKTLLESVALLI